MAWRYEISWRVSKTLQLRSILDGKVMDAGGKGLQTRVENLMVVCCVISVGIGLLHFTVTAIHIGPLRYTLFYKSSSSVDLGRLSKPM